MLFLIQLNDFVKNMLLILSVVWIEFGIKNVGIVPLLVVLKLDGRAHRHIRVIMLRNLNILLLQIIHPNNIQLR